MFNIFKDTVGRDLMKIANHFNGRVDSGEVFKDKKALAINRIKNAVLEGEIGGGGVTPEIEAEIENAQWKTETSESLFNETVTTADQSGVTLTYASSIDSDVLTVIFDGVEYTCPKNYNGYGNAYGATYDPVTGTTDFTDFPFQIYSSVDADTGDIVNTVTTETAGEHTVSVVGENITYKQSFLDGVKKNSTFIVKFSSVAEGIKADKTVSEIKQAYNNGYLVIGMFPNHNSYNEMYYLQDIDPSDVVSFVNHDVQYNEQSSNVTISLRYIVSRLDTDYDYDFGDALLFPNQ